jgi:hypothetical protein
MGFYCTSLVSIFLVLMPITVRAEDPQSLARRSLSERANLWRCEVEGAFACKPDGCSAFDHSQDPLVRGVKPQIELNFSTKQYSRPGWSMRPFQYRQDGIYSIGSRRKSSDFEP